MYCKSVGHSVQITEERRKLLHAHEAVCCTSRLLDVNLGWWEGGNTSSVEMVLTKESHSITQRKREYKYRRPVHLFSLSASVCSPTIRFFAHRAAGC